jgi:hypothetical protein
VLVHLDVALTAAQNRPDPDVFEVDLKNALAVANLNLGDKARFDGWCAPLWDTLLDTLCACLLTAAECRIVAASRACC